MHSNFLRRSRPSFSTFIVAAAFGLLVSQATAGPIIITTIGTSGGFPGGQTIYQVSNLAEGDAFNLDWFYLYESTRESEVGIRATGMVTVTTLTSTQLILDVMLTNTSDLNQEIRVTSFGLGVDGFSGLNSTATGGSFLSVADTSNFPGFGDVDVCATAPTGMGTNCAGGGGGGIEDKGTSNFSDSFMFDLAGSFGPTVTLSQFALKFQTGIEAQGGPSLELPGVPTPKLSPIPEPSTLILLGLGLVGLGWAARRKSR